MADTELLHPRTAVRVLTYAGQDAQSSALADVIHGASRDAVADVAAADVIAFDPVVNTLEGLQDGIADERAQILHIVSHANRSGDIRIKDVWGDMRLTPEALAAMLVGRGIRVVIVSSCFGVQIADALVAAKAVDLAIGCTQPLSNAAALAFSRSFYRSLARGDSPIVSAEKGREAAQVRFRHEERQRQLEGAPHGAEDVEPLRMEIIDRADVFHDPMVGSPIFYVIGEPSVAHRPAIGLLIDALAPDRVFHISQLSPGGDYDEIDVALRGAKVIMVLLENDPLHDYELLEQIQAAIVRFRESSDLRRHRKPPFRLFPVFLEGDRQTVKLSKVPFGMRRLVPAYLHEPEDPPVKGDDFLTRYGELYDRLVARLQKLV